MDLRRLRAGEWIAAIAGATLCASLFLDWYSAAGVDATAWEAFAVNDVVLTLIALYALALLPVTASQRAPAVPIAWAALTTIGGIVGTLIVLARAIVLPDGADARELGLWIALAGALGTLAGGAVAMRDERLSKPGRPTDATGSPIPAAPDIEVRPAPRG